MFKRKQQQTHQLKNQRITVSYDRLTSRLLITSDDGVIYSRLLFFIPLLKSNVIISDKAYRLKVLSFIIWRAKLEQTGHVVIPELLERRRSKSIGSFIYGSLMAVLRFLS